MSGTLRTRPRDGTASTPTVAEAEITKSAAAARQLICTLPAGALILKTLVQVLEAFNAGTSNLITVGYGAIGAGTADDFADTVTEGTPGMYPSSIQPVPLAVDTDVYAYYTPGAADATTGKARVFIEYVRLANNG